jgi:transposase
MSGIRQQLIISPEQRSALLKLTQARSTPQHYSIKAQAILRIASGESLVAICEDLDVSRTSIGIWRKDFDEGGVDALITIKPGRGRKSDISAERVAEVIRVTTRETPDGATQWTCRSLGRKLGMSHSTIQRIWDANGLKPHRTETFKLSTDKQFVEKMTDVVGLYMNPPDKAVVLCVDEKSQIQALDRTQPGLPMKKGRCGTMTHDYKRNGTTTLFAALNVLDGKVIGECFGRHRHIEYLRFLRRIDRAFPGRVPLHLIVDNYATHKHEKVQAWLAKHPRFEIHYTPTSSSWLNLVERWFRDLTCRRLRRGAFQSVAELIAAIEQYIAINNADPKPFEWTVSAKTIAAKIAKCKSIYETLH